MGWHIWGVKAAPPVPEGEANANSLTTPRAAPPESGGELNANSLLGYFVWKIYVESLPWDKLSEDPTEKGQLLQFTFMPNQFERYTPLKVI